MEHPVEHCTSCGHALGVGRYCTNCGHPREAAPTSSPTASPTAPAAAPAADPASPAEPADPRRDVDSTAERPAVRAPLGGLPTSPPGPAPTDPAAPPPVFETPQRARYPLYADDPPPRPATPETPLPAVQRAVPAETTALPVTNGAAAAVGPSDDDPWAGRVEPVAALDLGDLGGHHDEPRDRRTVLPWLLVALALVLVAGMGLFLLTRGGSDDEAADPSPGVGSSATDSPSSPSTSPSEPSTPPTSEPTTATSAPVKPSDVSADATARAPRTAGPGTDVDGGTVRYDAANMLDDDPATAWRAQGSLAGESIVFTLAEPTRLTSVGLVNGYAKRDPGYDGYTANRRVLEVRWTFDDGSTADQTLTDSRDLQTLRVGVETRTVRMTLVRVSEPGRGSKGRDFTAISTVRLVGAPA